MALWNKLRQSHYLEPFQLPFASRRKGKACSEASFWMYVHSNYLMVATHCWVCRKHVSMTSYSQNGGILVGIRRAFQTSIVNRHQKKKKKRKSEREREREKKKKRRKKERPAVSILSLPSLSTGLVMCRSLYSTPIDRTRDVSYSLFHPYRQDPWCVVFFIPSYQQDAWCVIFFIPPLSTGPVMCHILYSTPIDGIRDVSLARFPFNQRAVKRSSPRATCGYQNEGPKGTVALLQQYLPHYSWVMKVYGGSYMAQWHCNRHIKLLWTDYDED